MYTPASFSVDDPIKLSDFLNAHSFATLVSCDSEGLMATHLPIRPVCQDGRCTTLVSHMARANPQWRQFSEDVDVLVVFTGPHAYISPTWYRSGTDVPTWNYTAVHVYGRPRIIRDHAKIVSILADTVDFYEKAADGADPIIVPDEYRNRLIQSIVAFEIQVTRIEGKFKLGQNRSSADINAVYTALANSKDPSARMLAEVMASEGLVNGFRISQPEGR